MSLLKMLSLLSLSLLLISCSAEDTEEVEAEEEVVDVFAGEEAVRLTDTNYEELTHFETLSPDDWFVKFYAPWCGHCRKLAPVWEEVAVALKGKINVGKLDVTTDERVGRGMNITRLPTLMLFRRGRTYVYPRRGTRTVEAMVEWALSDSPYEPPPEQPKPAAPKPDPVPEEPTGPTDVVKLDTSNFAEMTKFTEEDDTGDWFIKFYAPWCGHCKRLAPTWEEVATELKDKVNVAKIDVTTNKELGNQFDIKSFPTLIFFKDGKMQQYDGQRDKDALCEYATSTTPTDDIPTEVAAEPEPSEAEAVDPEDSDVTVLDTSNFETMTKFGTGEDTGDWFIEFYAPWCGHCKRLAPTWEEVATELKGKVNVAKVDVTENQELGKQFGVKGFPTLLLFKNGKMEKYKGDRSKEALCEHATTYTPTEANPAAPVTTEEGGETVDATTEEKEEETEEAATSDVITLVESNFDEMTKFKTGEATGIWFIKFYAPWCGHCKRLAPTWEEVATELKGKVNVAKVDVTENKALGTEYGVKGFPTLLLFKDGKMEKYKGDRGKEALCEYATTATPEEDIPGVKSEKEEL